MVATLIAESVPRVPPDRVDELARYARRNGSAQAVPAELAGQFEAVLGWPDALRSGWLALRRAATDGKLEELHENRDLYRQVVDGTVAVGLMTAIAALALNWPKSADLERAARELVSLRDEIFSGWGTLDELAEKLMPDVALTHAQLVEIAKRNPPPQSWYDETDDPFAPVED